MDRYTERYLAMPVHKERGEIAPFSYALTHDHHLKIDARLQHINGQIIIDLSLPLGLNVEVIPPHTFLPNAFSHREDLLF